MAENKGMAAACLAARTIIRVAALVGAVMILVIAAKRAYKFGYGIFDFTPVANAPGEDIVVTIQEDMSARKVGKLLEEKGLIRDDMIYWVQSFVYEYDPAPGTYLLNTSETLDEMMEIMSVTESE